MKYYSPWFELTIESRGLVEAGQVIEYDLQQMNDDKMVNTSMLVRSTARNLRYKQRCINCSKVFIDKNYLQLHRMYGCGRQKQEFHGLWIEEAQKYGYELHLLGVQQ